MDEEWRPVLGASGFYEVSDLGRVRSVDHSVTRSNGVPLMVRGRILRPYLRSDGRLRVDLKINGRRERQALVHRLVLEAFAGPCPSGMEGCHNDGDPSNNALTNLRWDTRSNNQFDAVKHGTHPQGGKQRCKRNHLLQPPNLYRWREQRQCVACVRARHASKYQRKQGREVNVDLLAERNYAELMKTHGED